MKRLLSIFLALCILLMPCASAITAFAQEGDEVIEDYYEDPIDAEEPYLEGDTIYDLENEVDTPPQSEAPPPQEDI